MFCPKCGKKIMDSDIFCQNCGTKLSDVEAKPMTTACVSSSVQSQANNTKVNTPPKKKPKKVFIIVGVVLVVILAVVVALNWEGDVDYVATVKAYQPYASSLDLPYTCGEVFDKYISHVKWNTQKFDDTTCVEINGTISGTDKEIVISIDVSIKGDQVLFDYPSIKVDGKEPDVKDPLFALFYAYDEGAKDLSHFDELLKKVNFILSGGESETTITDENIDSTVTVDTEYPDQVVFDGVPTSLLLEEYIDTIIDHWGTPLDYNYGNGYNYCNYDGIELAFDYEGIVYNIQMDAYYCVLNGIELNTTRDTLVTILGDPTEEGYTTRPRRVLFENTYYDVDIYYMTFQLSSSDVGIRVEFDNDSPTATYVYLWNL